MKKNDPKAVFAWTLYDFANTSFTVIVITVVFPIYFKSVIVDFEQFNMLGVALQNPADFFLGLSTSVSFLIVAITAPVLGAYSDITSRKKKYIFYYSLLCIIATSLIPIVEPGQIAFAVILLILGNIGFETGIIYYDALLPIIATEDKFSKYSGYGFAAGYLGALITLAIAMLFINGDVIDPYVFPAAAIFFLLFIGPFFAYVKERKVERSGNFTIAVRQAIATVRQTIRNLRYLPAIRRFIGSFFFYINGVLTIIAFGGIYASTTLNFTLTEVIIFFLAVQFSAMIGSFLFGWLGEQIGEYRSLLIVLMIWMLVCVMAFTANYIEAKKMLFYVVGVLAGVALGSSQSLSRSYYSRMIPVGHEAEFFGFYALSGRFAAVLGPLVFGLISAITGQQHFAVLSVLVFFATGMFLLRSVPNRIFQQSKLANDFEDALMK